MHPVKYGDYHHRRHLQQQQQQFMANDASSPAPVFFLPNPNHHHHQQQQQSIFPYPLHTQQQQQRGQQHEENENLSQQQHSGPITHQLLEHHHYQFQPFQNPEPVHPHPHPHHVHHHHHHQKQQQPFSSVNFKLGLNENSGKKEAALPFNHHQNEATFLHGNQQQQQQHSLLVPRCLHPQEDSPIKEPFWKPLNRCEDRQCSASVGKEIEGTKYNNNVSQSTSERSKDLDNKYRLFGELEAIYGGETAQACSGSALTGENSPANIGVSMPLTEFQGHNVGANIAAATGVDHGSEASIGKEEASLRKLQKKKRKTNMKDQLSSMVGFFENLVKQVTDHQEGLHKRFLEVIERIDNERSVKEESWRRQEVEKRNREAIARAHERALASNREALIVSYLEKITGESIDLPKMLVQPENAIVPFNENTVVKVDNSSRWPIAEVETLIQVRCNLESKFREPGLKGPVWEEVSSFMSSFGYQRSAKRCKEKWENINKYFRKSKENGKKRSQQSKTCSYFDKLDQLYSRIPINSDIELQKQGDSNFLEPYIPQRDLLNTQVNVSGDLKLSEMNSDLDFGGTMCENVAQGSNVNDNESHGNYLENEGHEREDDDNDSDGGE